LERVSQISARAGEVIRDHPLIRQREELTNSGRPKAEAGRDFLGDGLAIFDLGEEYAVLLNLLNSGIGQDVNAVTGETALFCISINRDRR
jgi:hypothetical protein